MFQPDLSVMAQKVDFVHRNQTTKQNNNTIGTGILQDVKHTT